MRWAKQWQHSYHKFKEADEVANLFPPKEKGRNWFCGYTESRDRTKGCTIKVCFLGGEIYLLEQKKIQTSLVTQKKKKKKGFES